MRVNQPEQDANSNLDLADSFNAGGHWTAAFVYDDLGNVLRATDANGVNIIHEYDKANRVTQRCYTRPNVNTTATSCAQIAAGDVSTDTPAVQFWYDGKGLANPQQDPYNYAKGKLTKVDNGVSTSLYMTFDNFGRLTRSQQITDGITYGDDAHPMTYTYNLSGALIQETYPSGRVVKNDFESDGDLSRIYGKATASSIEHTYASDFRYMPDGRISQLRLGSGLWEEAKFNTRLQVTELGLGHGVTGPDLWKLNYDYGEVDDGGDLDATKNTGNIGRQTLSFSGLSQPFVQTYKYDPLERLKEAVETSGTGTSAPQVWKESYGYDRYGNRSSHSKFSGTNQLTATEVTDPTIDPNTNRFDNGQDYSYDKNGNLIADADSRGFTFNADNKQTKVTQNGVKVGEYFFDGEGKRVKKVVYDPNGSGVVTEVTVFVYSNGKLIGEYSTAPPTPNPTTNYTATDQLGSPRVITNALGQVVSRRDFMPFGEEVTPDTSYRTASLTYTSADNVRQKFTGYQKDDETGLDFAEARMYEDRHGRFTAVDPLLASGKSANPQSFNRYTYVMANPLLLTDSTGLQAGGRIYVKNEGDWNHYVLARTQPNGFSPVTSTRTEYGRDGFTYRISKFGIVGVGKWNRNVATLYQGISSDKAIPGQDTTYAQLANGFQAGLHQAANNFMAALVVVGTGIGVATVAPAVVATGAMALTAGAEVAATHGSLAVAAGCAASCAATFSVGMAAANVSSGNGSSPTPTPTPNIPNIYINGTLYPQTANHILNAQSEGYPSVLTIDRPGADARSRAARAPFPPISGLDRDEYPPAVFLEGGHGASIEYVDRSDNRGAGASMRHQMDNYADGRQVRLVVTP